MTSIQIRSDQESLGCTRNATNHRATQIAHALPILDVHQLNRTSSQISYPDHAGIASWAVCTPGGTGGVIINNRSS